MRKVKVSPKGQVVIPKPLRDKFGIKEGEEVLGREQKRDTSDEKGEARVKQAKSR